jgi:predicted RNase H-like HicB family nuclease
MSHVRHLASELDGGTRKIQEAHVPRTVHIPITVERDEDGVWCARAQPQPGVWAHGDGATREAAIDDLREALEGAIDEFGIPEEELEVTVA